MAEDGLTTLVNQVKKYSEFARRILRRWWIVMIFFVLGAGGSVAFALTSTRIYQSRAFVEWKRVVDSRFYGDPTEGHVVNRLKHQLGRFMASNTLLLKIASDLDLYPKERRVAAPEVILEYLRNAIKYNVVGTNSFWISFDYKDKKLAQKACARLVHEFIQQNVRDKLRVATDTQALMEKEATKVQKQRSDIAARLSQFKSEHPELQFDPASGRVRIVPLKTPRGPTAARIKYLAAQSPELQAALAKKGKLQAQLVQLNPAGSAQQGQARTELATARRYLLTLRQKYTDKHPDVQAAQRRVHQAQQRLFAVSKIQRTSSSRGLEIKRQIAELDAKIVRLSRPRRVPVVRPVRPRPAPKTKKPSRQLLSAAARLEKRWYELTSEETVARSKLEQIQVQLQRSRLTAKVKRRQAEKEFTIVDRASRPGKPIRPSRKKIVMAGTALGLMVGLGLAALLVLFDPRIYNEDDLRKACNLEVLAQIPKPE